MANRKLPPSREAGMGPARKPKFHVRGEPQQVLGSTYSISVHGSLESAAKKARAVLEAGALKPYSWRSTTEVTISSDGRVVWRGVVAGFECRWRNNDYDETFEAVKS